MLILASASPRRSELLTQAGYSFQVHPAHINEDVHPGEAPIAYVTRLAREKAQSVYTLYSQLTRTEEPFRPGEDPEFRAFPQLIQYEAAVAPEEALHKIPPQETATAESSDPLIVFGADTTVSVDDQILGKPEKPADAARMLRLLSGRSHRVITGVALVSAQSVQAVAEVTIVHFLPLSDQDIADYIATGEPRDKAGAYAIQGRAANFIHRIEGCYFNVVGLPLARLAVLLQSQSSQQPG
jgi:septum formation protein